MEIEVSLLSACRLLSADAVRLAAWSDTVNAETWGLACSAAACATDALVALTVNLLVILARIDVSAAYCVAVSVITGVPVSENWMAVSLLSAERAGMAETTSASVS